jgi:hypothetical protein
VLSAQRRDAAALLLAGLSASMSILWSDSALDPMADMPSEVEVGELTAKAAEKVEAFQKTLDSVKPYLDKADPSAYKKDSGAIDTGREGTLIAAGDSGIAHGRKTVLSDPVP